MWPRWYLEDTNAKTTIYYLSEIQIQLDTLQFICQLFAYTFHGSPLFLRKGSSSLEGFTGTFIICPPTDLSKPSVSWTSQALPLCLPGFKPLFELFCQPGTPLSIWEAQCIREGPWPLSISIFLGTVRGLRLFDEWNDKFKATQQVKGKVTAAAWTHNSLPSALCTQLAYVDPALSSLSPGSSYFRSPHRNAMPPAHSGLSQPWRRELEPTESFLTIKLMNPSLPFSLAQ